MRRSILCVSIFLCALPVAAETIVFKSGATIDTKIVERTGEGIKVDFQNTILTYYFDEIDTIDGEKPLLPVIPQEEKKEAISAPVDPDTTNPSDVLPKKAMSEEDKLIDHVLELNGIKKWLSRLPEINEMMVVEVPASVKGNIEGFRKFREDVYGSDSLNRYFYESLKKYYDEARFKSFRDFLLTPLGRKMTGREKAIEQLSEQELKTEQEAFFKEVPTERRYALVSRLIHQTQLLRLELIAVGHARVLMFKTKFHMTEEQLQDEIAHLIDEQGYSTKGVLEAIFPWQGFLCRHFSDQELEEYIQNMSSPDIEYVQEAIYQSVVEAFAKMRKDYVSSFRDRFPDSAADNAEAGNGEENTVETLSQKRDRAFALKEQADEYWGKGDTGLAQQTLDKAFGLMEQVLFLDPDDVGLCVTLGISYQVQDYQLGRAVVLLEKAIALGEQVPQVYDALGYIYLEWGKLDHAEELFNKALTLSTDSFGKANAYYALGNVYRAKGQLDRAVEVLEQAIAFYPEDSGSYGLLGFIAAEQGKIEMAEKYLKQAEQFGLDAFHVEQVKASIRKNKKSVWPF